MMYQWTDGEVSHVVKLALESVRSSALSFSACHRSRLIETLASELSASAWHAHAIAADAIEADRQRPWKTIASDLRHDWSEFCPFEFYAPNLQRLLATVETSGCAAEEVAQRSRALPRPSAQHADPHHALAWLAVQPDGNCVCVEFLKRTSNGPFTLRDEAVLRILSTELLAEPACGEPACAEPASATLTGVGADAARPNGAGSAGRVSRFGALELAELAELPRRQREVLSGLLAGASVKEIASDLGISPYTVNDYIKALYRRYQVSSRGELMAALHGLRRPAVPK